MESSPESIDLVGFIRSRDWRFGRFSRKSLLIAVPVVAVLTLAIKGSYDEARDFTERTAAGMERGNLWVLKCLYSKHQWHASMPIVECISLETTTGKPSTLSGVDSLTLQKLALPELVDFENNQSCEFIVTIDGETRLLGRRRLTTEEWEAYRSKNRGMPDLNALLKGGTDNSHDAKATE